jgi:DNA topoisomerase-6 subunit A
LKGVDHDKNIKENRRICFHHSQQDHQETKTQYVFSNSFIKQCQIHSKERFLELIGQKKSRTLTVNTVKTFAQTLRVMSLSKELIEKDDIATKREAYYVSKNWDEARFEEQPESDTVIDDVEAMFEVNREQLGFIPEEKGGDVAGKLVVIDKDQETGQTAQD